MLRRLLSAALVAGAALVLPTAAHAAEPVQDLGVVPLTATTTAGGQTVVMPDGSLRSWTMVSGKPGYLAEIDPVSSAVIRSYPLSPLAQGSWAVEVARDGTVWVASYGRGELFRLRPGATEVENLGAPNDVTSFLWAIDTTRDGDACVGNYEALTPGELPPAHLYCYRTGTDTWQDYGTFAPDATLVRSVAVVGNHAYVGTGPVKPRMWKVNLTTGAKQELTIPSAVPVGAGYTYEMDVAADRFLFVRFFVAGSFGQVLDTRTGQWTSIGAFSGSTVSAADRHGWVYLVQGATLMRYNVMTGRMEPAATAPFTGSRGLELVTDPATGRQLVVAMSSDGRMWQYDVATDAVKQVDIAGLTGTLTPVRALASGPEGDVYVSGYFSGGLARYSPTTGTWQFNRFTQIEGMVAHGGRMYLGSYTGANLWEFDPAKEFVQGTNPKLVASMTDKEQERPFGMASTGKYVVMGTQPKNGHSGGGIGIYDPATGALRTYIDPAGQRQVDAVASDGTTVFVGASAFSTLGQIPGSGLVIAMDPATGAKKWEIEPMPGEKGVGGLTVDSDGDVWGVTLASIFELDGQTGAVKRTLQIAPYDWTQPVSFNPLPYKIRYDAAQDELHVSAGSRLYSYDESTLTNSAAPGVVAAQVIDHSDGMSYWLAGQNLYRTRL